MREDVVRVSWQVIKEKEKVAKYKDKT